jgi:hypothetical protein
MDAASQIRRYPIRRGGWMAPNEARRSRNLPPVKGGESPMIQQQNYSLAALAKRDALADPFGKAQPAAPAAPAPKPAANDDEMAVEEAAALLERITKVWHATPRFDCGRVDRGRQVARRRRRCPLVARLNELDAALKADSSRQ